jgi:hypothetical protein
VTGQLVQLVGALLILAAFAAAQLGFADVRSPRYLWANAVGSFVLAAAAWHEGQWGFLLLEGVWALVSAWGLVAVAVSRGRGRSARSAATP